MIFRAIILRTIAEAILDHIKGRKLAHQAWISYDPETRTVRSGEIRTRYEKGEK